jgi:hypothetical protein
MRGEIIIESAVVSADPRRHRTLQRCCYTMIWLRCKRQSRPLRRKVLTRLYRSPYNRSAYAQLWRYVHASLYGLRWKF